MQLAVLGPVVLTRDDGTEVQVTPRQAREVLTILALQQPRSLSLETLATHLWDEPPPAATKTIQGLLSRLRRALALAGVAGPGITGRPGGYRLDWPGNLDVVDLHRLAQAGRQALIAGSWTLAASLLAQAQALFRGMPELPATAVGEAQLAWIGDLRDSIAEDHVEAAIRCGHHDAALAQLELLTTAQPLRERLWALRMVALEHSGRVAEAMQTYLGIRRLLVEELGLEPGPELNTLQQQILDGETPTLVPRRRGSRTVAATGGGPPAPRSGERPEAEVRYVAVDDIHVAYCSVSDGPCDVVIMVPGVMPVDCLLSEPLLAAAMGQIATFARVTWINRRGVGLSDRCTADNLPTMHEWARDLAAVLDAINARSPIVYACEDTTGPTLQLAADQPERLAGVVLTNAFARFTRGDGYPHGFDPVLAEQSATETMSADPAERGFDLLTVIAPSVAKDTAFRAWWDRAGRQGASPRVARALRSRLQNSDLRDLLGRVTVPVLHLVNPNAPAHDAGHDRYLQDHLVHAETHALSGPDELWWLDASGEFIAHLQRFVRERTPQFTKVADGPHHLDISEPTDVPEGFP